MSAAFIGLDLAKSVFQVHGVDVHGKVVVTKRLRRDAVLAFFANLAPCVVGMEACAGSHFWAREIARLGHTVRLMAPQYVKPYVKRQKNDRADAAGFHASRSAIRPVRSASPRCCRPAGAPTQRGASELS
jgi:transposase